MVQESLTQDTTAKANHTKEGLRVASDKHALGFDTGDAAVNVAAPPLAARRAQSRSQQRGRPVAVWQLLPVQRQTSGWQSWKVDTVGSQPLAYLVRLGTRYALVCVSKWNATFSREESQKIDYALGIYHHSSFVNEVREVGGVEVLWRLCENSAETCTRARQGGVRMRTGQAF